MKIRHPLLIKAVGWLGAWAIRGWMRTLRYQYRPLGPSADPAVMHEVAEHFLGAFWHENLLLPAYHYGRPDVRVLISQHADGQMIAEVCQRLGFGLVRGSATRGGVEALRRMIELSDTAHLALTPDGPRGPRRRVKPGLIYLAAWTGMPIVVLGIGYDRPWRMKSWDQFALPRPFSRAVWVSSAPIRVPGEANRDQLELYRRRVEAELERTTELAARWAESGVWPAELEQAMRASEVPHAA